VGGPSLNPYTVSGQPSYYFEYHAGYPQGAHAQLTSLVVEGVFEAFAPLRYVLQESGFGWVAPLMWRLDRSWRQLRGEVPHLRHEPSHYIREHVYFTTQPIEEPERPEQFAEILKDLRMDDHLLFATDYPHWDFDAPDLAIPRTVGAEIRAQIMSGNARRLYNLVDAGRSRGR
jgi:predicted TIM-barrel fold metal-dependent hydrolase